MVTTDLIEMVQRQQAEIERLRSQLRGFEVCAKDWSKARVRLVEENERMRAALERISCPTQSKKLLWWQELARSALSAQGDSE